MEAELARADEHTLSESGQAETPADAQPDGAGRQVINIWTYLKLSDKGLFNRR